MKNTHIRRILVTSIFIVSSFAAVLYTSGCKKKCGSVTCQNSGTCVNDTCSCPSGYTGTACETMWSTQYLGSYTCTQSCTPPLTGSGSWQSTITTASSNGAYTISISNFGNLQASATAYLDGNGGVTVAGVNVAGNGTFADGVLTIHYTTSTNNVPGSTCNLTMTKQ
ncbi:MAG: hypothetical protein BGO69_06020 [Bacteroidetes bacterium 46-16]|nr:MAG: hypothetical protein BGO69_06020 [Bacteroidetes bacterium 46-16]